MEQRIGPTVPPTPAAGVDPAFVPGLLPPPSAPADDAAAAGEIQDARTAEPAEDDAAPAEEAAAPDAAEAPGSRAKAAAAAEADDDDAADDEADGPAEDEDEDDGKPVFKVADRRASITADRAGIVFRLDGEEAEFGWDEVQAVEIDTPRFGRRFSVTVYTSARRWFQSDVEAPSRGDLKTWTAELDAVLDARFEEGGEEPDETPGTAEAAEPGAEVEPGDEAVADEAAAADRAAADDADAEPKAEPTTEPAAEPAAKPAAGSQSKA